MATCWSIRYSMGRNGNMLVSLFTHYVWQHAGPRLIVWSEMAMCQSFHPNIVLQHAGPYVIVWVEMATCWSVHRNFIWQHGSPYFIVWVKMVMCLSFYPKIIWQYASPYVILWAEMAMCWSVHPNIMYGNMPSTRYIRESSFVLRMDGLRNGNTISRSICACATHTHLRPW